MAIGGASASSSAHHGAHGRDHRVEFYETDAFLIDTVVDHLAPALEQGGAAIVVAAREHRGAFDLALAAAGIDVEEAVRDGRCLSLDAGETLAAFMSDDGPDAARFEVTIGSLVDRAGAGGREVRIYGEMVALLWGSGEVGSAIAMEDLWNDLAATRGFSLLCGYPLSSFDDEANADAFRRVCEQHSAVIPSETFPLGAEPAEQRRLVADLQREGQALRAEVERLRSEQAHLAELGYADALTGLANGRAFELHLEREWGLSFRDGIDSFVLVANIDDFQRFNNRYGRKVGDEVLRALASVLLSAAPSTCIVARTGGDEFGVLLVRSHERAADRFKSRARDAIADQLRPRWGDVEVSFGHASLLGSSTAAKALDRADLAMLASKRAPRGRGADR